MLHESDLGWNRGQQSALHIINFCLVLPAIFHEMNTPDSWTFLNGRG